MSADPIPIDENEPDLKQPISATADTAENQLRIFKMKLISIRRGQISITKMLDELIDEIDLALLQF